MMWLWPDASTRRRGLPIFFRALIKHQHLAGGGSELVEDATGTIVGVALWDPPGGWQTSTMTDLRMLPALIRAFGRRLQVGSAIAETMKKTHPTELHWYLAMIGTDPSARGAGHGRTLLRSRLDRCDAEHSPAYLESSKLDNVPYYERFGFEVTGEIVLPAGGPTVYPMWRNAR